MGPITAKRPDQSRCVYLFNSAPADRPAYRRGVLDALAYPDNHQIVMSYQRKYIAPALLKPGFLENRQATLVFLDTAPAGQDHTFIPIRLARVVACDSAPDANRVELRVELSRLIPLNPVLTASIRSVPGRPSPYHTGKKPGKDYFFVLEADPIFTGLASGASEADVWEALAHQVRNSYTLSDAVLIWLSHIRPYGRGSPVALGPFQNRDRVYMLQPNRIFEMDLRVLDSAAETTLSVRSSSDLVAVTQAFPTTIGGLGTYRVVISCKRTLEKSLAAIFVDVADSAALAAVAQVATPATSQTGGTVQPVTGRVRSSKPVYLIRISPPGTLLLLFIVFIFFGFFLSNLSKEFFSQNPRWTLGVAVENAFLTAKILGAVFLACAAWIGFRKLPSGGSGG